MNTRGMKLIGKGSFSKVYDNGDNTVTIKTKDWTKEALALWVDNDRFPAIERVEYDEISTYKMKKFDKVKAIKRDLNDYDYALYTYLRKNVCVSNYAYNEDHDYSKLYELFSNMPEGFKEDAQKLIDAKKAIRDTETPKSEEKTDVKENEKADLKTEEKIDSKTEQKSE